MEIFRFVLSLEVGTEFGIKFVSEHDNYTDFSSSLLYYSQLWIRAHSGYKAI